MGYLGPVFPGGAAVALPGGTAMIVEGVQQHRPILTILGVCVVVVGVFLLGYLRQRRLQDARAAGV